MAARFWTYVFGWLIALALALAWLCGHWMRTAAGTFALLATLIWLLLLLGAVAVTFALARGAAGFGAGAGAVATARRTARAFVSELLYFGAAWLAMMRVPFARHKGERSGAATQAITAAHGAAPVLLIHGLSCNGAIWTAVRQRLCSAGLGPVRSLDLEPLWVDLESHLPAVLQALEALERSVGGPVTLLTHSVGGLIARALLRVVEPQRIRQLITLGTPHHGTALARCLSNPAALQLRPGSLWLRALNAAQEGRLPVPVISIYSRDDNIVAPADSAVLSGARMLVLQGLGHFGLLHSPAALNLIETALRGAPSREQRAS